MLTNYKTKWLLVFFNLVFPHYKPHDKSMGAIDPQGMASLNPRGLIGKIHAGDH